jgi:protein SCO1/2
MCHSWWFQVQLAMRRIQAVITLVLACTLSSCASPSSGLPRAESEPTQGESLFARPWVWNDEQGAAVGFFKWRGTPLVVSAIYTSCTSTCPLTIEKLRKVDAAFRRKNRAVEFLLITLDPHTDTPDRLRRFKESSKLPERWHLLRGSDKETQELSRLLHVRAVFDDAHIIHDVRIAVFDEQGQLKRSFRGWTFQDDDAVIE